ncbi:MAG: TIGR02996 domain-containing protein [Myxococcales bacterium]|nr:TIGR02996 domain-containing protein [Myxococcales bacterium]
MGDVLAVVSKAVFEKQAPKGLALGGVWPLDRYVSKNPGLASLSEGGALFLVTVRPPDERLWLVAVLEGLSFDGEQWVGRANVAKVVDVTPLLGKLVLATGKGITAEKGKLGMSLQTPRPLAEADVALLRGAIGGGAPKATAEKAKTSTKAASTPPAKPAKAAPTAPPPPAKAAPVVAAAPAADSPLGRALDAVAKTLPKSAEEALDKLLEAWRARPAAELATLGTLLANAHAGPRFEGSSQAWAKAAKASTMLGRSSLLAALREGKMDDVGTRVHGLIQWGADPRVGDALITLLREVPYTSDGAFGFWDTVWKAVEAQKDPRFALLAEELPKNWNVRATMQQRLSRALVSVAKKAPPEVALTATEQVQVRALEATLVSLQPAAPKGARTEAALLADVYTHPDEDGPRLVYADFLEEKGDPRAELIQLQCAEPTPANDKRVRALLTKHGKEWLGPLAPVLGAKCEFRRGFLAKAVVKFKNGGEAERFGSHPAWATLVDLEWSKPGQVPMGQEDAVGFVGPTMTNLRVARGPSATHLLSAPAPWKIEELEVEIEDLDQFRELVISPLLPALRTLHVAWQAAPSWLEGMVEVRPRTLVVEGTQHSQAQWVEVVELTSIEQLDLVDETNRWIFRRGEDGGLTQLTIEGPISANVKKAYGEYDRPVGPVSVTAHGPDDVLPPKKKVTRPAASAKPTFLHVRAVAWTKEGLWVCEAARVTLIDPIGGQLLRTFPINEADKVAISRDGRRVFTVAYHRLEAYSTATGKAEWKHAGKTGSGEEIDITPDGRFALAANQSRALFCDLDAKTILREQRADTYYSACISPLGKGWAQTQDDFAYVFTPEPKARGVRVGEGAYRLGWLGDDRLLVGHTEKLEIWDPWKSELLHTLKGPAEQFVEHGGKVACIRGDDLCVLDTQTWKQVWKRKQIGFEEPKAFSPDGQRLLVMLDEGPRILDAATGKDA